MDEFQDKIDAFWDRIFHPLGHAKTQLFSDRGGWFLYFMAVLCVLSVGYLSFSIFTYTGSHFADSGVGSRSLLTLENTDLTIISESLNPKTRYAQLLISAQSDDTSGVKKIGNIVAVLPERTQLKSDLVQVTDQYYVLKVYHVPMDYRQLVIDIGVWNENGNASIGDVNLSNLLTASGSNSSNNGAATQGNFEQGTWKVSGVHMSDNRALVSQSYEAYVIMYARLEQQDARTLIKKIGKIIDGDQADVQKTQQQITSLRANEKYQTPDEIQSTENTITNLQSNVENDQSSISDQVKLQRDLQDKIKKLELQIQDANQKLLEKGIKVPNK
ncbi:hypothetical protein [Sporolactobacillus sp. KGMB 08714]|uniref:hypothetical protein n=1 Tax=Sporolactobacillus sp. KGMB 08714 TaxID=3064704 RepID=UPI002FBF087A